MNRNDKDLLKAILYFLWVVFCFLLTIAFWITLIYIGYHFAVKYW